MDLDFLPDLDLDLDLDCLDLDRLDLERDLRLERDLDLDLERDRDLQIKIYFIYIYHNVEAFTPFCQQYHASRILHYPDLFLIRIEFPYSMLTIQTPG